MVIPIAMIELDEAHTALGEASREQTIRCEGTVAGMGSVDIEDTLRLLAHIHKTRHARLHFERHLVLRDTRGDLRIVHRCVLDRIELIDRLDRIVLELRAYALRALDVEDRITRGVEFN